MTAARADRQAVGRVLADGGRALGWLAGLSLIGLAVVSAATAEGPEGLFAWLRDVFGPGFAGLYLALAATALFALQRGRAGPHAGYWRELAAQAASGIATLALTFTLLGISLGIGALAEQPLTPETVAELVAVLTAQFSMAFMTTVVGLPTAAVLRAAVALQQARAGTQE